MSKADVKDNNNLMSKEDEQDNDFLMSKADEDNDLMSKVGFFLTEADDVDEDKEDDESNVGVIVVVNVGQTD